jgi:1-acyl-sn-glycerol-3-phosphate acyltransferase
LRLGAIALALIAFASTTLAVRCLSRDEDQRRLRLMGVTQTLSALLLRILGITVEVDGDLESWSGKKRGTLFLANHVSYVDAILLHSLFPAVFITSREIETTPVLGWITRLVGCSYVERRRRTAVQQDVLTIASLLAKGFNVTLFPEATTSTGLSLLKFRSGLLEALRYSRAEVVPLCIKYQAIDGVSFTRDNCDLVTWYGDMEFFPHFMQLLARRSITVRISLLPRPTFRGHRCRKRLAVATRDRIQACLES